MKTRLLKIKVEEMLLDGPMSSTQIKTKINTGYHGTTSAQLGNVLGKNNKIMKLGVVKTDGGMYRMTGGDYEVCFWALKGFFKEGLSRYDQRQILAKYNCVPL